MAVERETIVDELGNRAELVLANPPSHSNLVVVMSHGFGSSKESGVYLELELEITRLGASSCRYDYYGCGPLYCNENGPRVARDITLTKAVGSLAGVVKFLRAEGFSQFVLLGSSFGGLVSIVFACQDRQIKALVLRSPVTDPKKLWEARLSLAERKEWEQKGSIALKSNGGFTLDHGFWQDICQYQPLEQFASLDCPCLIIHGDADQSVPVEHSVELANVRKVELEIVKGADHSYSELGHFNQCKSLIRQFVKRQLE